MASKVLTAQQLSLNGQTLGFHQIYHEAKLELPYKAE